MATAQSVQFANAIAPASSTAGIKGASLEDRSTQVGYHTSMDTFVIPASGAGSANGDVIQFMPMVDPTTRLRAGSIAFDAMGAGVTLSVGKQDPNNSANTDAAHYLLAFDASVAGTVEFNLNIGEQMGADPLGDQSTGNTAPAFGAARINMTVTIGGGTPTAAKTIRLITDVRPGGY